MPLTPSLMLPLGTKAPDFDLLDVADQHYKTRDQLKGRSGLLVMFICNHCPFVQHIWSKLNEITKTYQQQGVGVVAISSNDIEKFPEDGPLAMAEEVHKQNFSYPYLFDESQDVAKAYQAACTPDFFLFDAELKCVYRGQFDGSRPENGIPVTGEDLTEALDALVHHRPIFSEQNPSIGCNIKWK